MRPHHRLPAPQLSSAKRARARPGRRPRLASRREPAAVPQASPSPAPASAGYTRAASSWSASSALRRRPISSMPDPRELLVPRRERAAERGARHPLCRR